MKKYTLLFIAFLLFAGCSGFPSSSRDLNDSNKTDVFIGSISNDNVKNSSVAKVPHNKNYIPMLVVLVNYNNIQVTSSDNDWSNKLFGKNPHELNHYYLEVSNSNFEFTRANESSGTPNDGIIRVTLNKDHPNTDLDQQTEYDNNHKVKTLSFKDATYPDLKNALLAADQYIDFSQYDTDSNKKITPDELLFTFIIAGYEDSYETTGHVTNGVWAHQYCMTSSFNTPTLDSVSLMGCNNGGNFALFGEKHDTKNPHDATIGIIAHELGHSAFSLPDLYNTYNSSIGGIGYFGLMGSGLWTQQNDFENPGDTPVHLTAWSKMYNGWITPQEYESNTTVALNETSSSSYNVIKIPISANHYYLLENRNNSGYDRGLYYLDGVFDGGMAIWHINENKLTTSNFVENIVNVDTKDKGVDLVEAGYSYIDYGRAGHEKALFYDSNVNFFGDKITNISSRGSQMTLNIN